MRASVNILHQRLYHLLFWLIAGAVWFYLRYDDYATLSQAGIITAIKITDIALVIYVTNLVLVPRFLYQKKNTGYLLLR